MVTNSDLFEFVIMLIAFATFIYKISKKNNRQLNRPPEVRPKNLTIGGRFSYGKI